MSKMVFYKLDGKFFIEEYRGEGKRDTYYKNKFGNKMPLPINVIRLKEKDNIITKKIITLGVVEIEKDKYNTITVSISDEMDGMLEIHKAIVKVQEMYDAIDLMKAEGNSLPIQ